jgi:NADH dehydrogenase
VARVLRRCVPFDLGGGLRSEDFAGVDVVVHLAYDREAGIEVNFAGVGRVFDAAAAAGVARQIFVSSYSARPDAVSEYGRLKYRLETFFLHRGHTIVRPGLVIGDGGLFARNMEKILHTPLMPLLDGGIDLLPVVAAGDLALAITVLLDRQPGAYNLFNPELVTMRRFVAEINRAAGHRAVYFSIPVKWAVRALFCASKLRVRLPIDLDNLRGLKQNQKCPYASGLETLVPEYHSFESMIQAAVAAHRQANP